MSKALRLSVAKTVILERKLSEVTQRGLQRLTEQRLSRGSSVVESASPLDNLFKPQEQLGDLFADVQLSSIFSDSKTFVDCSPLIDPKLIVEAYNIAKNQPGFSLAAFIHKYFHLPKDYSLQSINTCLGIKDHIKQLWPILTRAPEDERHLSSLIRLPNDYIVPGGRFREVYYWDSFFTMLGLQKSNLTGLIQDIVDNFTYLIDLIGHIPNGNREYYISRSQPPFYSLMLEILAQTKGEKEVYSTYELTLMKEYKFWMDGADHLTPEHNTHRRVVRMPDGAILNRFYDDLDTPRPESYREDVHMASTTSRNSSDLYRNIRAAAESGWDFSSRWFTDPMDMTTIRTIELIPVDLNSLMYHMELTLAKMAEYRGDADSVALFTLRAEARRYALITYCWSDKEQFFFDYDFVNGKTTDIPTLAAGYPLYFKIVPKNMADGVANKLENEFLSYGGLLTTLVNSTQQWDAPNGWAPLQWINIQGLKNYNYNALASSIVTNWTTLNIGVHNKTGKLMEKYNVKTLDVEGGGGEYPTQDGFGWTNGVFLALLNEEGCQI